MQLVQFWKGKELAIGVVGEQGILDVTLAAPEHPVLQGDMDSLIQAGPGALEVVQEVLGRAQGPWLKPEEIRYAPVVTRPEKIICVGVNYRAHAEETGFTETAFPVLFNKYANALAAHNQEIPIPACTGQCDYEAELVMIMGKTAVNVAREDALDYVFGYTVGNDLTARDLQFLTHQWMIGKTCDGFAPVGPMITTADMVDPDNLEIACRVNGEVRQSSNTGRMIHSCASIISILSRHMTLKPGDIIFTGTPEGVILGYPEAEQVWLKPGDVVEVTVEDLGTLRNRLV